MKHRRGQPAPFGHRFSEDPIGSHESRGKDTSRRKSGRDGNSWTPTEQRKKDQLMKQFTKLEGASGNSEAYVTAPCWCWCGRLKGGHGHDEPASELARGTIKRPKS